MKKEIKILDCTLRDGGYYNNWDFENSLYKQYFNHIKKSKIDAVEIGFRFFEKNKFLGPFAYSTDEFLKRNKLKHKNLSVMINASDIIKTKYKISNFLDKKSKSNVSIVRIASHFNEYEKIKNTLIKINNLGYRVFLNLMQISEYPDQQIKNFLKNINKKFVDVFYFADSFGNLNKSKTKNICKLISDNWDKEFGIHSHDNQGLALENCIAAYENGASWFDGTMSGMGRGAGNVTTQDLLRTFNKKKNLNYNLLPIKKMSPHFEILKKKYKWGKSSLYSFAAKKSIHTTYVQNLTDDKNINRKEVFPILKNLSKIDAKKYELNIYNEILEKQSSSNSYRGSFNFKNFFNNKNVIILAKGPSLLKNRPEVENFIRRSKAKVLCLNYLNYFKTSLINFYVVSHYNQLTNQSHKLKMISKKVILPKKRFQQTKPLFKLKNIKYDYGIKIVNGKFETYDNYSILPNNLAFTYSLSLCKIGNAKQIFLAGFDGYKNDDERNLIINYSLNLFRKKCNIKIKSLFHSVYHVEQTSIYSPYNI